MTGWTTHSEKPPERSPGESDADYFMRILPRPPLGRSAHDDIVAEWLEDCLRVGGIGAIEWLFCDHLNWPLGQDGSRGRMLHYLNVLRDRAEGWHKAAVKAQAEAQQRKADDERRAARKAAGWA